ncbi:MAG TPA: response regulator [Candidatus Tectomicrobia bacterium]|nr:response regulator [Candidatus Tectomicrobia bacterium]
MARILVIDDDPDVREIVREALEAAGHEVREADDGDGGLALLRQSPADLVITDIFMPGKEGLETILDVRQEFPGIKIIAISGGGGLRTLDYLPAAREFGAILAIPKPFDCDLLVAAVRDLLAR